ncbi:anaerobic ribonucleoside-triphosphate reductase-activating protein [Lachnospiraceae bacterium]|nr:anaerobic ribonucleoside-triphosphate reductase-activating protein [Lachnospiraceae bacterium]
MKYANIKYYDISNGTGVRTSLFVSGCTHRCKGCFNEIAWDFQYGSEFTGETIETILSSVAPKYISGLSLLGGEPMEPPSQRALLPLARLLKERFPEKNIWCYTGYTYETDLLSPAGRAHCEVTGEFLSYIDVLVDGEFVEELYDISLPFRGSKNQRILALCQEGCPELYPADGELRPG